MVADPLVAVFPGLTAGYRITSEETPTYNCIAWAAGFTDRWWWPHPDAFWPADAPNTETLDAFAGAFGMLGYRCCPNATIEAAWGKIVIFADADGVPTHAARQLENGKWTSKLGESVDIEHGTPDALAGVRYGTPVLFMHRRRPVWRRPLVLIRRAWTWMASKKPRK